jgi:hypothetical protein
MEKLNESLNKLKNERICWEEEQVCDTNNPK